VSLPAADELFRSTTSQQPEQPEQPTGPVAVPVAGPVAADPEPGKAPRAPSGRVRHDEKMTVYVTAEELLDIEHARLDLRRLGVGVDRGRLVRAAIALALADLDAHGEDSEIVRHLTQA
jgi:hypothetical protein